MQEESIADTLGRLAGELEATLAQARRAHDAYAALPRRHDTLADQILVQRTRVGLYTAGYLVAGLREESENARRRAPDLTVAGLRLPPRPRDDTPETVLDWWAGLSEDEREGVMLADPLFVGSADGLPYRVRHRANMAVLEAEIERRTALAAEAEQQMSSDTPAAAKRRTQDDQDLRGLLKLRALLMPSTADQLEQLRDGAAAALARISTPHQERFLYLLDPATYPLKAAVVLGDLDTADHVVLHVPGATTTVDLRLFREAAWMSHLRTEASRHVDPASVAVVDWIGYQAPVDIAVRRPLGDSGVPLLLPGEAADARFAHEAVPALVRCARGLRVATQPGTRLVASGHSYGGSVVGLALAETDVFDAAVVTGCPGLFTGDAADLHVPTDALFAATAPGDLIALLGVFGGPTHQVRGIRSISARARPVTHPDGTRTLLLPTFGHEAYYNAGTATLHGIGAVAAGAIDQVRTTRRVPGAGTAAGDHAVVTALDSEVID